MKDEFNVEFEWLPRDYGSAVDRNTLAELSIMVLGQSLMFLDDKEAKTTRDRARVSAYYLARWFAGNWWRLRWEPDDRSRDTSWLMSHHLAAAGGGYVWPTAIFVSDGETMLVAARPTKGLASERVRYLANFDFWVKASSFETGVDQFVDRVIDRLSNTRVNDKELFELWREVLKERRDPSVAAYRKLEAMLGFDPDEAPENLLDGLLRAEKTIGRGALEEISAALKRDTLEKFDPIAEAQSQASMIEIPQWSEVSKAIRRDIDPTLVAWQRATEAARLARTTWGLKAGPIRTKQLAELFGFDASLMTSGDSVDVPFEVGYRSKGARNKVSVALRRRHPRGRRFALARLVGDHVVAKPADRWLPATEARTERQKFQRAFAQEFLCPYSELSEFLGSDEPDEYQIEEAADYFDVSPMLVNTTLVNKGAMDRSTLAAYHN